MNLGKSVISCNGGIGVLNSTIDHGRFFDIDLGPRL